MNHNLFRLYGNVGWNALCCERFRRSGGRHIGRPVTARSTGAWWCWTAKRCGAADARNWSALSTRDQCARLTPIRRCRTPVSWRSRTLLVNDNYSSLVGKNSCCSPPLDDVEDRIQDQTSIGGRTSAFGGCGEQVGRAPTGRRTGWFRTERFSSPNRASPRGGTRSLTLTVKCFRTFRSLFSLMQNRK